MKKQENILELDFNGVAAHVCVSMGATQFRVTDQDYHDGIKRADIAMYESKRTGKCKVTIDLES